MKKFLLSLAAVAFAGLGMTAAPITVSLAETDTFTGMTGEEETVVEKTLDGVNFSFFHCKNYKDYLMVCGKNYEGAYIEFSAKETVSSFQVHTGSNASNKVTVSLTCNGEAVAAYTDIQIPKASDYQFTIPTGMQAAGTKYRLTVSAAGGQVNAQYTEVILNPEGEVEPPVGPSVTVVKSIAEAIAVADGTSIKVDFPMTVAFKNNKNVFACDATGDFIQLYGANEYEVNDIVPAGWEGTYKLYNGTTPEIEPTAASLPAADGDNVFVPAVVDAADISVEMVNHVIAVADVVLTEASPATKDNFEGTSNGTKLNLRNNYTLPSVPAGTYNMTLLVTIYQGEPSLYVVNYDANVSGSSVITVEDVDCVPAYYTLQGVKVANPENGLYIVVKNGKATKVLVK
ncbi:MAG: hypothetical protein K2K81_10510 [Muribaculaceae bacterium]|nr:hypothetical protein [Muribaculaceae bacterium]